MNKYHDDFATLSTPKGGRNKAQTCEERIDHQLHGRLDDFAKLNNPTPEVAEEFGLDSDLSEDEIAEELLKVAREYSLDVSTKTLVRIDLSSGGPADWFEVVLDEWGVAERITYHFADWFDHAEVTLEGDDFEIAETFLREFYCY